MGKRNSLSNPYFYAPLLVLTVSALITVMKFSVPDAGGASGISSQAAVYGVLFIVQLLIFGIPCGIFCLTHKKDYIKTLPFSGVKRSDIPIAVCGCLTLVLQSCALKFGVFYSGYDYTSLVLYGNSFSSQSQSVLSALLAVASVAILPAFTEEFLFRGILMKEYSGAGKLIPVLVSALFFSAIHFDLSSFITYFTGGLLLAWIVQLTNNATVSIIIHLCYNLFVMFGEKYVWLLFSGPDSKVIFRLIFISLYLLSLFVFLILAEKLQRKKALSAEPFSAEKPVYFGDGTFVNGRITGSRAENANNTNVSFLKRLKETVLPVPFILEIILFITVSLIFLFT